VNIALPVVLPILSAFLLPIVARGSASAARLLGPAMAALNIVLGLFIWQSVAAQGPQVEALGGYSAPLGIVFYGDQLASLMVVAISALTLLLWPKGSHDPVREPVLTLLLMAGACGIALSGDLFNLFVFYELLAVASYGLVASQGSGRSYIAALRFLILSATGSAMALLGIALIYTATGTLNLAYLAGLSTSLLNGPLGISAFALLLVGFGVKAELFPVNTWVPEVYATTTSRVSGLLCGVISKVALLILLKLLLTVFDFEAARTLLLIVGILSLLSGELAAYRAQDLRRVLGYSSIAQLGIVAIAFSVDGTAGVLAGIAVAMHHLLAKPALFLLAEKWGGQLERLRGASTASKGGALLFVFIALSLIGVPPLPGFWAKYLLLSALFEAGQQLHYLAAFALLTTTVIEAAYLMRIATRLFEPGSATQAGRPEPHGKRELIPALLLGGSLAVATLVIAPIGDILSGIADQAMGVGEYARHVPGDAAGLTGNLAHNLEVQP